MITYLILPLADLAFFPQEMIGLFTSQLTLDGEAVSPTETENRLRRAAQSGHPVYLFAAIRQDPPASADTARRTATGGADSADQSAASGGTVSGGIMTNGAISDPAEILNSSSILAVAFGNINFGLECGGEYLWINELYIREDSRRQGVGSGLLEAIESWARERAMVYIACLTGSDNAPAQGLYVKNGYSISSVNWVEKSLEPGD